MKNEKFKDLLDQNYQWPTEYRFKFIVPKNKVIEAKALAGESNPLTKESGKGNFIGLTFSKRMSSSDQVLTVYRKMASIEGIISL